MKNITSCAAGGVSNMMGKKNGCLKLMKDENPERILVHCVTHRENLVAKNISSDLIIKCINAIKANAKCERLFKLFCEEQNADHVRFLLHTEGDIRILERLRWGMAPKRLGNTGVEYGDLQTLSDSLK
ncbi:protein FAM200A-like [Parasteatoda tepidariorum]|uniref:protein FAM200A-like n=1 Tax=Parasteatoda tepidariorum TaxID=114398 RepID=UPI0039BCDB99